MFDHDNGLTWANVAALLYIGAKALKATIDYLLFHERTTTARLARLEQRVEDQQRVIDQKQQAIEGLRSDVVKLEARLNHRTSQNRALIMLLRHVLSVLDVYRAKYGQHADDRVTDVHLMLPECPDCPMSESCDRDPTKCELRRINNEVAESKTDHHNGLPHA